MASSIASHQPDCRCPVCARAGKRSKHVTTLLAEDVAAWLRTRPEGLRAWIEAKAREEMEEDLKAYLDRHMGRE